MAHPLRKGGSTILEHASLGLSAIALIAASLHADCTELKWRDGLQIALGFDAPPAAAASIDHDGDGVPTLFAAGEGAASGISYSGLVRLVDGRWQPFGPSFTGSVAKFERFDLDGDGVPSFILLGSMQLEAGGPRYSILEWTGSLWVGHSTGVNITNAVLIDENGAKGPSLIGTVWLGSPSSSPPGPLVRWTAAGWANLTPEYTITNGNTNWSNMIIAAHDSDGDGRRELFARAIVSQSGASIAAGMARWDGAAWSSAMGSATPLVADTIQSMCSADTDGDGVPELVASRFIAWPEDSGPQVVAYDGNAWRPLGERFLRVFSTETSGGAVTLVSSIDFGDGGGSSLVAAGVFDRVGTSSIANISRWDGKAWTEVGGGLVNAGYSSLVGHDVDGDGTNELVAFGNFVRAGTEVVNRAAAFNGTSWNAIGTSAATLGLNDAASASVLFDHDGDGIPSLIVGGVFSRAGTVSAPALAAFDGASWQPIANPWTGGVDALLVADLDGDGIPSLYGAGDIGASDGSQSTIRTIAVYMPSKSGGSWTQLGASFNAQVETLSALDHDIDGQKSLFAGGYFTQYAGAAIGRLARWTGSTWAGFNPGSSNSVNSSVNSAVMFDDDGNGVPSLIAGLGRSDPSSFGQRVRKWNGASWVNLGSITQGHVFRLQVFDHDGDGVESLFAFGQFYVPGGIGLALRYESGAWVPFGPSDVSSEVSWDAGVGLLRFDDDGDGVESVFLQGYDPFSYVHASLYRYDNAAWTVAAASLGGGAATLGVVADIEGDGAESLYLVGYLAARDGGPGSGIGIIDPCVDACPADLDGSGSVDSADLAVVLSAWGPCSGVCAADLDESGEVDSADLGALLAAWGGCP
jgi:hypothetical protein